MKNLLSKLYLVGIMALAVYFIVIIWKVTFAHIGEEYHSRKEIEELQKFKEVQKQKIEKTTLAKIILEGEERVKYYLGYRILEERRIEGHFHHIGFDVVPDNRAYCIKCHGDVAHDAVKEIRAFLNMHSFFIACQTCHVKLEGAKKTGVFKWYDKTTGEIIDSPVARFRPGTYRAKILSFERVDGKLQRVDSQDRIDFANEYKEREKTLSDTQKTRAKKLIHNIVSKQAHTCEDCHQREAPLLPFEVLGYPKERINSLLGTEVVGMIKNYTQFYMPRMLHPGEAGEKGKGSPRIF